MLKRDWLKALPGLLLLALACGEDPATPVDPGPGILGTLLAADGSPAAGAPVGVIFGIEPEFDGAEWPPAVVGSWDCDGPAHGHFGLELPEPSTVTARILDHGSRVRCTLADHILLPAGRHDLAWDFADNQRALVPNGAYRLQLRIERPGHSELQDSGTLLLNRLSLDYAACVGSAAVSDGEGNFFIPYAALPLGAEVHCGHGQTTCTVPDSLWIQSAVGSEQVRTLLRLEDLETDLPLTLQFVQRRD